MTAVTIVVATLGGCTPRATHEQQIETTAIGSYSFSEDAEGTVHVLRLEDGGKGVALYVDECPITNVGNPLAWRVVDNAVRVTSAGAGRTLLHGSTYLSVTFVPAECGEVSGTRELVGRGTSDVVLYRGVAECPSETPPETATVVWKYDDCQEE
ncbi:MAG: hypothetical protein JKY37_04060 [Nannocystaceae bacterium]|nr:hypothetical protein [Nannocystaceae bacterium]